MLQCCRGVALVLNLALLCGTGLCANRTIPASDSVIAGVLGTQNISLYCDLRDAQGESLVTNWFLQTHQAREGGQKPRSILSTDENFIQSGDTVVGTSFSLNTNLTIISLTDDLDDAIIFCGFGETYIANFTLRIYRPPVLLDGGVVTRRENEELSLDLSDPDSPPAFPFPSEVMWSRQDGVELMNFTNTRVFDYSSIYIGSVVPSDAGIYTLTAANHQLDRATLVGTNSASFTLNVLFGAGLSGAGSETVAVVEGESVTLVCGTGLTGNPIPTVTWRNNTSNEVMSGGRFTLSSGRDVVSLTLDSSERGDAGNWTCTAQVYKAGPDSLTVGGPEERSVQLVVVVAPSAPELLQTEYVGATWVSLSWFHNQSSRGIPSFSRLVILVTEGGVERNVTVESGSTATNVTGLLPGTDYMFRVVAVSVFGGVQAPSPPSTSVNATTNTSVPGVVCHDAPVVIDTELVISWSYVHTGGGGLELTGTLVEYRNENSALFMALPSFMSGSGPPETSGHRLLTDQNSTTLPLPLAGVKYFFRVTATNEKGSTTVDCPSILLTTGIPMVPNRPELISQSDSEVNITLSTNYSGVHDPIEDSFHFILHIEKSTNTSVREDVAIPVMCPEGGEDCSTFYSLSPSRHTYNISASSKNRYGLSDSSTTLTIFPVNKDGNNDYLLIIGVSIGGGVILVAALVLLLAALYIVKGRNSGGYNLGNNESDSTLPPITNNLIHQTTPNPAHIPLGEPQEDLYDNSEYCEGTVGTEKHTTFHSPKRETESTCQAVCDVDGMTEATDEPVDDSVAYQAMNGPSDDDSYEEIFGLYDVPRCVAAPTCDTFDNSAYNAASFDNPVYFNISIRHNAV